MTDEPEQDVQRVVLTKGTYNHPPAAVEALTELTGAWRMTRTDALNRALQLAAVMCRIAPGGQLTIARSDGTTVEVYLV
ncbi:hypothetical protein [Micromonospora sp. NPDC004704]